MTPPRVLDPEIAPGDYREIWTRALVTDPSRSLRDSAAQEAAEYFKLTAQAAQERMAEAEHRFAQEWNQHQIDPKDQQAVEAFYNSTETEVFELLDYHTDETRTGALRYVAAFSVATPRAGRRYLDFGSGIGSGAILFAHHGFQVTIADISEPLLKFAAWRFAQRRVPVQSIDLRTAQLPAKAFDVVTCFDVLEHVVDPQPILKSFSRAIAPGGLLCIFAPLEADVHHPMHIMHDRAFARSIRGLGFRYRWDLQEIFVAVGRGAAFVFERVARAPWHDALYGVYDRAPRAVHVPIEAVYRRLKRVPR